MSNYTEINGLFNDKLAEVSDLPVWKRENKYIEFDDNELYLTTYLVNAPSQNTCLGSNADTYESGTFIINVSMVRGNGWGYGYDWVDTFVTHFKRGTQLTNSSVCLTVNIKKAYPVAGFYNDYGRYVIPIHIEYYTFVNI